MDMMAFAIVHVLQAHTPSTIQKLVNLVNLHAFNVQAHLLTVKDARLVYLFTKDNVDKIVQQEPINQENNA